MVTQAGNWWDTRDRSGKFAKSAGGSAGSLDDVRSKLKSIGPGETATFPDGTRVELMRAGPDGTGLQYRIQSPSGRFSYATNPTDAARRVADGGTPGLSPSASAAVKKIKPDASEAECMATLHDASSADLRELAGSNATVGGTGLRNVAVAAARLLNERASGNHRTLGQQQSDQAFNRRQREASRAAASPPTAPAPMSRLAAMNAAAAKRGLELRQRDRQQGR